MTEQESDGAWDAGTATLAVNEVKLKNSLIFIKIWDLY